MSSITAYQPSTAKGPGKVFRPSSFTAHRVCALAIITVGLIYLAASLHVIPSAASRVLFPRPHETPVAIHILNQKSSYCPWCTEPVLCARKFLFVIATGRSGSTTVMGMLNAVPGVFLSGENNGEASRLRALFEERVARRRTSAANATANLDETQELLYIQRWIWETNVPPAFVDANPIIVGFKEIRWTPEDVTFIQQVCPCSRFVVNARRNAHEQATSAWYRNDGGLQDVMDANRRLALSAAAIIPSNRAFELYLEDFDVAQFDQAAAWLGIPCRFRALIHSNKRSTMIVGDKTRCV